MYCCATKSCSDGLSSFAVQYVNATVPHTMSTTASIHNRIFLFIFGTSLNLITIFTPLIYRCRAVSASQAKIQKKLEIIHKSGIFNMKFGANNCIMVGFGCESLSGCTVKFVYIIIVHPPSSEKHGMKLGLSLV